jgi:hypothetical protein
MQLFQCAPATPPGVAQVDVRLSQGDIVAASFLDPSLLQGCVQGATGRLSLGTSDAGRLIETVVAFIVYIN